MGALTTADQEAIAEAIDERAAIRQFDGGEPRETAEARARAAMRAFDALSAMPAGDTRRVTMILPGCSLAQALEVAEWRFPGRVLEVCERGGTA